MKNRILSYLLGGVFLVLIIFPFGFVNADCTAECAGDKNITECIGNCVIKQQQEQQQQQQQQMSQNCSNKCKGKQGNEYITCFSSCITQQLQQSQQPQVTQQECKDGCCGIKLNTDFPILGDCIHLKEGEGGVDGTTALPYMIGALMKIIMSIIMVICFIIIIIAGIKRASNDPKTAKDLIKKVAITILLLGLSGVILKVVNPLFFA